jgi:hypothetical protein
MSRPRAEVLVKLFTKILTAGCGLRRDVAVGHWIPAPDRAGLVAVVVFGLGLLAAGCQAQAPTTTREPAAVQREAEMLKKQNEEMLKKR